MSSWSPQPHEEKKFEEIYIDETSQTGHRFLVVGGIVLPYHFSAAFEEEILEARLPRLSAVVPGRDKLREIGWKTVSKGDYEDYKKVVDAYFEFSRKHKLPSYDNFRFLCSIIDTHVKGRWYSGKKGQIGFDREIYFHCMSVARNHKDKLFHVYPDDRETSEPIERLRVMLCRGLRKEHDPREWPFRRLKPRLSHEVQALQISDLLIGAVAYRINRHYDAPGATDDKRMLCDYIFKRGRVDRLFGERSFKTKNFGQFQLWMRRHKR